MKTIDELKKEIEEIRKPYLENGKLKFNPSEKTKKKINTRIRYIQECIRYLETNLREEFIEEEINRLKNTIEVFNNRFDEWNKNTLPAEREFEDPRTYYEKVNNYTHIKSQIKTLKYILG